MKQSIAGYWLFKFLPLITYKNIPVNFMCPASSSKMLKDKNGVSMEVSFKQFFTTRCQNNSSSTEVISCICFKLKVTYKSRETFANLFLNSGAFKWTGLKRAAVCGEGHFLFYVELRSKYRTTQQHINHRETCMMLHFHYCGFKQHHFGLHSEKITLLNIFSFWWWQKLFCKLLSSFIL